MTPLFPLKYMFRHFRWWWLWGTCTIKDVVYTICKHFNPFNGFLELLVKWNILGIHVVFLVLQDVIEAFIHEEEAAMNFCPIRRRALLDVELREARGPNTKVFSIGFILKEDRRVRWGDEDVCCSSHEYAANLLNCLWKVMQGISAWIYTTAKEET